MNYHYRSASLENVTTRKKKSNMVASTVVMTMEQDKPILKIEIITQVEEKDIARMLEESKISSETEEQEPVNQGKTNKQETPDKTDKKDEVNLEKRARRSNNIDILLMETTLDDLNSVLGRIGEHLYDHDLSLEELRRSLEFSQGEIDDLKKKNKQLKLEIIKLKNDDKCNEYRMQDLDSKHERLDTQARKKNLVFEGVEKPKHGEKENLQRVVYNIFNQMSIDHPVECNVCYRTGPYNRNRPRPIMVTFLKQADRDHVFAKRMSLKDSKDCKQVWINEVLAPPARRAKTMVRLMTRQAQEKGVPCKTSKFSITVDNIKYSEESLRELTPLLSTKNVKQVQIDANTIVYQSEYAPLSSPYPARVKIGEYDYDTS